MTKQRFIVRETVGISPHPIHPNGGVAAPRFRNNADAALFLNCLNFSKPFPRDKWVHPYKMIGDLVKVNPEYEKCPVQLFYFCGPTPTIEDVKVTQQHQKP